MTNSITKRGNMGSMSFRIGTISATALQTTEEVDTGMKTVQWMVVTLSNTTTSTTTEVVIDEAFPTAGSAVTVNFSAGSVADRTYTYFAIGYP